MYMWVSKTDLKFQPCHLWAGLKDVMTICGFSKMRERCISELVRKLLSLQNSLYSCLHYITPQPCSCSRGRHDNMWALKDPVAMHQQVGGPCLVYRPARMICHDMGAERAVSNASTS